MAEYVLDHHLEGEGARLALMSRLLDPMHRRHIESLGVGPGSRTLEVGCGNGSVSAWLAERVGAGGRAVLHHVSDAGAATRNLVAGMAAGGSILLIEPDFLPVSVSEPPEVRAFWDGWLSWSRDQGIDYHIGRKLAPQLAELGLERIAGTAETAVYNGGSDWATYWTETIVELRDSLVKSGKLDGELVDGFLAHCADPDWWTQTIAFTAVHAGLPVTG